MVHSFPGNQIFNFKFGFQNCSDYQNHVDNTTLNNVQHHAFGIQTVNITNLVHKITTP